MTEKSIRLIPYRLTTAEITYHLPDHPDLLQNFIWQDLDLVPQFPVLRRFLAFWSRNLEGRLHSVKVGTSTLIRPAEFRFASSLLVLQ
jgi:uncharacterized protein Usg